MLIGLTGGIGSGKSTVSRIFNELGFKVLDCDELVEEIYATDSVVKASLVEYFGREVFNSQGVIDKKRLGEKVFSDRKALAWLEELVHPRVVRLWEKYIAKDPESNWVIEIPLLFEKNLETQVDITICLSAKMDVQLSRLVHKGMSLEDAKARIACQMPLEVKEKQSNFVIDNNGNIDLLRKQINTLAQILIHQP